LAEDNLNNQQVARELLETEGAIVEVANNGQEAVLRVAKAPAFDVVLMDLQMPVMDGFMATKHIRKALGLVDLPIIAMTANVMQSDKEACIQAGMNDHVGKPFDLHNLVNVLRLSAGWENVQAPTLLLSPIEDARYVKAAIAAKVDIASALARLGGKQELYVRMFPMFLTNLKELPQALLRCLETQEYLQASKQLHSLKGIAGTMGAMDLAAHAGHVYRC
jgi:CheY-like chemotaxis protein